MRKHQAAGNFRDSGRFSRHGFDGFADDEVAMSALQQAQSAQQAAALSKQFAISDLGLMAMAHGVHDAFAGVTMEDIQSRRIRGFSSAAPLPFTAFDGIRSSKHEVELTEAQESNVMRSLAKILAPQSSDTSQPTEQFFTALYNRKSTRVVEDISVPLPFVSAFFDQHCPEVRTRMPGRSHTGATYLLLSVITGHLALCQHCLEFGANPNNMAFLQDVSRPQGELFHGYSPVFMAVLAEQTAILERLCEYGGSVHIYDRWGRSPLHAAVAINSHEMVQWLMARGAPRFVGDCVGLIPAESADDCSFPELAMENASLVGPPVQPPLDYVRRQCEGRRLGSDCGAKDAGNGRVEEAAEGSGSGGGSSGTPDDTEAPPEGVRLCHCLSGRPEWFCGCVDDMFRRWAVDRLRSAWSPDVDYYALNQRQIAESRRRLPDAMSAVATDGTKTGK